MKNIALKLVANNPFATPAITTATVTIPEDTTKIDEKFFAGRTDIVSVEIPEGVTAIGDYAFEGCTSLESVYIPDSVITIGEAIFSGCVSLTSIRLPVWRHAETTKDVEDEIDVKF